MRTKRTAANVHTEGDSAAQTKINDAMNDAYSQQHQIINIFAVYGMTDALIIYTSFSAN